MLIPGTKKHDFYVVAGLSEHFAHREKRQKDLVVGRACGSGVEHVHGSEFDSQHDPKTK